MEEGEGEQSETDEDDLNDEDFMPMFRNRLRARRSGETPKFPPVPNPEGKKLMREGHFGTDEYYVDRLKQRKKALATRLMWRELGVDTYGVQKRAGQSISQVCKLHVLR
jgi:WD repeat-containing protein 23